MNLLLKVLIFVSIASLSEVSGTCSRERFYKGINKNIYYLRKDQSDAVHAIDSAIRTIDEASNDCKANFEELQQIKKVLNVLSPYIESVNLNSVKLDFPSCPIYKLNANENCAEYNNRTQVLVKFNEEMDMLIKFAALARTKIEALAKILLVTRPRASWNNLHDLIDSLYAFDYSIAYWSKRLRMYTKLQEDYEHEHDRLRCSKLTTCLSLQNFFFGGNYVDSVCLIPDLLSYSDASDYCSNNNAVIFQYNAGDIDSYSEYTRQAFDYSRLTNPLGDHNECHIELTKKELSYATRRKEVPKPFLCLYPIQ